MNTKKRQWSLPCLWYPPILWIMVLSSSIFLFFSCSNRHVILKVTTYPVNGTVRIDGACKGEAPITVALPEGGHVVAFEPYSEQYAAPEPSQVVLKGDTPFDLHGVYTHLFLPRELPHGFAAADSIRIYGTPDRKLKDGTIFDYINGGGLIYLKHGLMETTHMVYRNDGGTTLTLDIFDMGTAENADEALQDEELCPSGFQSHAIGGGCKSYHFEPDFILYFIKSRYLVYMSTSNDTYMNDILESAAKTAQAIP